MVAASQRDLIGHSEQIPRRTQIASGGRSTVEIKGPAGEAESRLIEKAGGKNVGFTQAGHLLSQENVNQSEGVVGRRMCLAIVNRVNARKRILVRESLIEPRGSKVLANVLYGIAKRLGNPARRARGGQDFRPVRHWPQSEQRLDACDSAGS